MFMDVIYNAAEIVEEYFRVWKEYDDASIVQLFSDDAKYNILPKRKVLKGREEIQAYWERNKLRQRNLSLSWNIISLTNVFIRVSFQASFFDQEENEDQLIIGEMNLYINADGKIYSLSETYDKTIHESHCEL